MKAATWIATNKKNEKGEIQLLDDGGHAGAVTYNEQPQPGQ